MARWWLEHINLQNEIKYLRIFIIICKCDSGIISVKIVLTCFLCHPLNNIKNNTSKNTSYTSFYNILPTHIIFVPVEIQSPPRVFASLDKRDIGVDKMVVCLTDMLASRARSLLILQHVSPGTQWCVVVAPAPEYRIRYSFSVGINV